MSSNVSIKKKEKEEKEKTVLLWFSSENLCLLPKGFKVSISQLLSSEEGTALLYSSATSDLEHTSCSLGKKDHSYPCSLI